ncbi:MAG: polysaccharide biosynthesis C-terminal domain-containing protein [Alphaproteobacteria bacterium]|nr:polysaccharide biosynthesis C-terminal domain-containing protein [Alphaproteobacteria bacterium]MBQ3946203.1 polysaccharide biosynthesis C-terminal domain-containing protein [Alphaproteobacteria bacterium]
MELAHKQIDCSFRTILNVSLPLILSALSNNLLYIIDRMILAKYSLNAMNAAVMSGSLVAIYAFFWSSISGIAEVYVGQSNGRKDYANLAAPVWQMIYFSLLGFVFYFPFGYFTEHLNLLPDFCKAEGIQYSKVMTYCASLPALKMAFASFFIGQGKTKIITYTVLFGSIVNAGLDILLVFGYSDIVPEMGCKGAAIATVLAEFIEAVILAIVFFSTKNRKIFKTTSLNVRKFDIKMFFGCIKLGVPLSIGRVFELLSWYIIYALVSHVSNDLATIWGICVSVYVLFAFVCDGLSKSSATISANFIGQKSREGVEKSLKYFTLFVLGLCAILSIPLVVFPESIFFFLDKTNENISHLYSSIGIIFRIILVNIAFESCISVFWGIFLSGGDTKYPMVVNLSLLYTIVVIPSVVLFFMGKLYAAETIYYISILWDVGVITLFYHRYKSLKWWKSIV